MTKLKKFLAKLKTLKQIHVIGASGTEGSEIALFLNKHNLTNVTLHDFAGTQEIFKNNFLQSHSSFPEQIKNQKLQKLESLNYKLNLNKNYLADTANADLIFVPQSWYLYPQNKQLKEHAHSTEFSSMTRLYLELFEGTTIGITGSNGKSTTTALIHHLIPNSYLVGNDRRTPQLLENIETLDPNNYLILEISNRQLVDTTGISPNIAVITNVTENHLAEHANFDEYKFLKSKIFLYQNPSDHIFLNQNDPVSQEFISKVNSTLHLFAANNEYPEFKLIGQHNLENLGAAILVAKLTGQPEPEIKKNIGTFNGLQGRTELVLEKDQITYLNDRQGTATDATIKALKSLTGNITLIFGGQNKGMPVQELCKTINDLKVLPIGIESPFITECLPHLPALITAKNLPEAVAIAKNKTQKPGTIIFSPACEYGPYFSGRSGHEQSENFTTICLEP